MTVQTRITRGGVTVTELGYGASQLGNLYRETSDDEAQSAVDAAWASGVRYFDTAPHYGLGLSERRLGSLLARRPREEYTVSTKAGRLLEPVENAAGARDTDFDVPADFRRVFDLSADGIKRSLDASLERLSLDRVDIVYLHDPDAHERQALDTALPTLIELRDQGLIGAVGAGMNQAQMLTRFVRESDIDIVMVAGRLTLLDQSALEELVSEAAVRDVSLVAAGVYNSGILGADRVPDHATYDYGDADPSLIARARAIAEVCARHGTSLPAAAIAFPLRITGVVSVVVGARDGVQAASNGRRFETPVPDELWRELEQLKLIPEIPHEHLEKP